MTSASFELLDTRIQQWIWANGWTRMRDAQEKAVPAIINADRDVIIAAATAAGKTEAAFLPVLTHMLHEDNVNSLTLYISPLKALINDQFERLEQLCKSLDIKVWPWHGDISATRKSQFYKFPSGILLITPESLEALFCNKGTQIQRIFSQIKFIVIDELHAFIGSERGKQLQSLMHRVDLVLGKKIPRIGLSATLGDMNLGAQFLRENDTFNIEIIESVSTGSTISVLLKGYRSSHPERRDVKDSEETTGLSQISIAEHIYKNLRGSNNLIFPDSRSAVETYTYLLQNLCMQEGAPNEFWPHHGNLSRAVREETERSLKDKSKFSSAICTSTLELGIDIGAVKSIAQIGSPFTVASLRQRLGRSGRREGEPAILRGYIEELDIDQKSCLSTLLRENLFQFTAMISLLLERWCEPPNPAGLHFSTLIQQLLSIIAQYGGITAGKAFHSLVTTGPFSTLSKSDFISLLRHLGSINVIEQASDGLLLLGKVGEEHVNHYSFYSAFATSEEYRIYFGSELLGTIPITNGLCIDQVIIFSGKTWLITSVDEDTKSIQVVRAKGGRPPTFKGAGGGAIDRKVRERMRALYMGSEVPRFLDKTALNMFDEGKKYFKQFLLSDNVVKVDGNIVQILPWESDCLNNTLAAMLRMKGITASNFGAIIEIDLKPSQTFADITSVFNELATSEPPTVDRLLENTSALRNAKWDWALPDDLLQKAFASLYLDIENTHCWLKKNFSSLTITSHQNKDQPENC